MLYTDLHWLNVLPAFYADQNPENISRNFPPSLGLFPAHMKLLCCALTLALAIPTLLTAAGNDWPRFLGPTGAAIVTESKVPLKWSDTENLLWKAEMPGPGASSPIVLGEKVFITCWTGYGDKEGANDMRQLVRHLICLNRADGNSVRFCRHDHASGNRAERPAGAGLNSGAVRWRL